MTHRLLALLALSTFVACSGGSDKDGGDDTPAETDTVPDDDGRDELADEDEDGFNEEEDCDDEDEDVFPGAEELCGGETQDCDEARDPYRYLVYPGATITLEMGPQLEVSFLDLSTGGVSVSRSGGAAPLVQVQPEFAATVQSVLGNLEDLFELPPEAPIQTGELAELTLTAGAEAVRIEVDGQGQIVGWQELDDFAPDEDAVSWSVARDGWRADGRWSGATITGQSAVAGVPVSWTIEQTFSPADANDRIHTDTARYFYDAPVFKERLTPAEPGDSADTDDSDPGETKPTPLLEQITTFNDADQPTERTVDVNADGDIDATYTFTYDSDDRLTSESLTEDGDTVSRSAVYDGQGNQLEGRYTSNGVDVFEVIRTFTKTGLPLTDTTTVRNTSGSTLFVATRTTTYDKNDCPILTEGGVSGGANESIRITRTCDSEGRVTLEDQELDQNFGAGFVLAQRTTTTYSDDETVAQVLTYAPGPSPTPIPFFSVTTTSSTDGSSVFIEVDNGADGTVDSTELTLRDDEGRVIDEITDNGIAEIRTETRYDDAGALEQKVRTVDGGVPEILVDRIDCD